ncbi:MAG: AAA family ATPase [Clostridia bacterium]
MGKAWTLVSGKGGVGRSTLTVLLGMELARRNQKILLVDLNAGLRNLDMLLGLENHIVFDMMDVLEKIVPVEQAIVQDKAHPGVFLLCAPQVTDVRRMEAKACKSLIAKLCPHYDAVLIDAPAGVGEGFQTALCVAHEVLLITCPDDASMRMADHVNGMIRKNDRVPHLVVNRIAKPWVQRGIQYTPQTVAQTLDIPLFSVVPEDDALAAAVIQRQWTPFETSKRPLCQAMAQMADRILGKETEALSFAMEPEREGMRLFRRLLHGRPIRS